MSTGQTYNGTKESAPEFNFYLSATVAQDANFASAEFAGDLLHFSTIARGTAEKRNGQMIVKA